jgi:hypothetical protein
MPFYSFGSGLSLQFQGQPVTGVTTLNFENGSLNTGGNVASFSAPQVSITDGTLTVSPLAQLTVNSLDLTAVYTPPSIVQKVSGAGGGGTTPVQLANAPTIGNYILFMTTRLAFAQPGGYPLLSQSAGWPGGYGGYTAQAYGGFFEGGANPVFDAHGANYILMEIENVSGVDHVLSGSASIGGTFSVAGDQVTWSGGAVGATTSSGFVIYGEAEQNHYGASSPLPAGAVLEATMAFDADSYALFASGLASETPTFGLTLAGAPTPGGFTAVFLKGTPGNNASITG